GLESGLARLNASARVPISSFLRLLALIHPPTAKPGGGRVVAPAWRSDEDISRGPDCGRPEGTRGEDRARFCRAGSGDARAMRGSYAGDVSQVSIFQEDLATRCEVERTRARPGATRSRIDRTDAVSYSTGDGRVAMSGRRRRIGTGPNRPGRWWRDGG